MLTHVSVFTGIGGIDLAADMAGFKTVGQIEYDNYCNKVLEKHWPNITRWGDVTSVTGAEVVDRCGEISLLSGGFPCQPVSCAGKRRGDQDERWLWDEMFRLVCEIRPRWVLVENVRGLLSAVSISDGRKLFGRVLRDLAEVGYRVGWLCYGAGDVGAPHRRERVFIVAHSSDNGNRQLGESGRSVSGGATDTKESEGRTHHTKQLDKYDAVPRGVSQAEQLAYPERTGTGGQQEDRTLSEYRGIEALTDRLQATEKVDVGRNSDGRGSEEVADTNTTRIQGSEGTGNPGIKGQKRNKQSLRQSEGKTDRSTQPPMGRVPDGFSAGFHGGLMWPTPNACDGTVGAILNENTEFIRKGNVIRKLSNSGGDFAVSLGRLVQLWPAGKWPTPTALMGSMYYEDNWRERNSMSLATAAQVWPAAPGEQYEWEPPRVATGIKDRVNRLKCLGNSVVPAQVYPILKAIAEVSS